MQGDATEAASMTEAQERPPSATAEEVELLRGVIADLREENLAILAANKAIRAEVMAIRKDMAGMNEVIKNVLSIYDAVCKDFNPFRDDDPHTLVKVPENVDGGKSEDL